MESSNAPWYASPRVVVSLRPQGGHRALREAARRHGARLLALSPWKLVARGDEASRLQLRAALAAPRVLFTSPAAVRFAHALQPLSCAPGQTWMGVGSGTAAALRRLGIGQVVAPGRMDSEGFLALPQLQALAGSDFGLVTAPEGRQLITETLQARGARVLRADVYDRVALPPGAGARARLRALREPACVLLSSGGALQALLRQLDAEEAAALLRLPCVAASARLAEQARAAGFAAARVAAGPRPAQMLQAAFAGTTG